jgi:hypothetical protein
MYVQVNIGNNTQKTAYKDINIQFPQPFGDVPDGIPDTIIVLATVEIEGISTYPDRYSVNVADITKEGFSARVSRLDGNEGWGMNLKLNYMATTTTIFSKGE